jgi:hypothetical protein
MPRYKNKSFVRAFAPLCVEDGVLMRNRIQTYQGSVFAATAGKQGASLFPRSSLLFCMV